MAVVLEGFAGPGGFSKAAEILGITGAIGIEKHPDACATATAAGHQRIQADIRTLDPEDFPDVTTWISGPPCPTYSDGGLRSGLVDYQIVLDGITLLGNAQVGAGRDDDYQAAYGKVTDARTALVLETLKFAFRLPNAQTVIAEQVPAVHEIWMHICAELAAATGWKFCDVIRVRFSDFGLPTQRERVILIACRDYVPDFTGLPLRAWWACGRFTPPQVRIPDVVVPLAQASMAGALGWPAGVMVNTRGDRKTAGGNLFSADGPAPSLTGRARSWYRTDLGKDDGKLTAAQGGLLQGFPPDHPWRGSRTSQFQRIADTISPLVGAAVLGAATGLPWQDAVWRHIEQLYGPAVLDTAASPAQLDLMTEVA